MKIKNTILTSLLFSSIYATSANAGVTCEYIHGGQSFCEALISNNVEENAYQWSITGGTISGNTNLLTASPICYQNSCIVQVIITDRDGNSTTSSKNISNGPSGIPNNGPRGGGAGNGDN